MKTKSWYPLAASALGLFVALSVSSFPAVGAADDEPLPLIDPPTVRPVDAKEFKQVLEHHHGQVILVNLWATWCIPCVMELPHLQTLQERYTEKGLRVIGVSMDDMAELEEKVRPFFKKRAPELVSYIQAGDEQEFTDLLDPKWPGVLPTSFVIDREGEVRQTLIGRKTFQEFEQALVPLL